MSADSQWTNQASLLTLSKARRNHLDTYLRTATMTATKRKHHDGEPDSSEAVKKLKMGNNDPHSPTTQCKVGVIQGPDDASIVGLFLALFYAINTFVQDYFKGAPYSIARRNDERAFFKSLTGSDCKRYLKSKHPGAKEAIMLAAIWNKLIDYLLSAPTRAFINLIPEITIRKGTPGKIMPLTSMSLQTANTYYRCAGGVLCLAHSHSPLSFQELPGTYLLGRRRTLAKEIRRTIDITSSRPLCCQGTR